MAWDLKGCPHWWKCVNCQDNNLYFYGGNVLYCNTCEYEGCDYYIQKKNQRGSR